MYKDFAFKIKTFKVFKEVKLALTELNNGNAFEVFRNATTLRATVKKKVDHSKNFNEFMSVRFITLLIRNAMDCEKFKKYWREKKDPTGKKVDQKVKIIMDNFKKILKKFENNSEQLP